MTRYHRWLAVLGDRAYDFLVRLNVTLSLAPPLRCGIAGYWSLAGYAKRKVKSAVSFIYDFEESVVRNVQGSRARRRDLRPHPRRRHPRDRRHHLHQLRRLGGQLHRHRRAPRRPHGGRAVGGAHPHVDARVAPAFDGADELPASGPPRIAA